MRSPSPRHRTTRAWRSWHSRSPPEATPVPRRCAPSPRRSTGVWSQTCPSPTPSREVSDGGGGHAGSRLRARRPSRHLTLNRPDRLNALSDAMIDAAVAALRRCAADPEIGAVLVTGAGRAFCAGGDVSAMGAAGAARRTFEDHVDRQHEMHELSWLLATIPKVTIAAVNGAAAGAGLGIALSCD